jgi:hypothetical protein
MGVGLLELRLLFTPGISSGLRYTVVGFPISEILIIETLYGLA